MNRGVLVLAAVLVAAAPATSLRTLHVDALSMRADATHLHVGQVFHLAIHAHVRETIAALDELVLPDVGTMQLLGDERGVTSSPSGTDVVERLTLQPAAAGTFTFQGAYVDAIDARNRKPSRFRANPVTVTVDASPELTVTYRWLVLPAIGVIVLIAALGFLALAVGTALVAVVARARRRGSAAPAPQPVVAPAAPPRTARDEVADALRAYRAAPQAAALMRLRGALFNAAGVPSGATLRDALAATRDPGLHGVLLAAERTAFGPAHSRDASSAELIDAVEGWLQ